MNILTTIIASYLSAAAVCFSALVWVSNRSRQILGQHVTRGDIKSAAAIAIRFPWALPKLYAFLKWANQSPSMRAEVLRQLKKDDEP